VDQDGHLDLFIGQDLGGVFHLEDEPGSTLSAADIAPMEFHVYPNPSTHELFIVSEQPLGLTDVFSMDGRWICTWDVQSSQQEVSVSHLQAGMYVIQSRTSGCSRKFIKQ
jgi:hypothetical protein